MALRDFQKAYNEALLDTDRRRALEVVRGALLDGLRPEEILLSVVVPGIEAMISRVTERGETNLAQHFMASQIAAEVTEELIGRLGGRPEVVGRMVIGTSSGDFHGLGKRIVCGCLKAQMIDAVDLGFNVPPERFVDEAVAHGATVIGISSMMVHTARGESGPRGVRRILQERGLEGRLRLVVGGAPYVYDPELYRKVGADAWAENGIAAGPVIVRLMREVSP